MSNNLVLFANVLCFFCSLEFFFNMLPSSPDKAGVGNSRLGDGVLHVLDVSLIQHS